MKNNWSNKEIIYLINYYNRFDKQKLLNLLCNRTWFAILSKARELKIKFNKPPEKRFWLYVNKIKNECWEWTGGYDKDGYGLFTIRHGCIIRSHRYSWENKYGYIPKNLCVCHKCDNPKCVNPNHLFLATSIINTKDRDNKNRQAKGEKIHNSKLTEKDIIKIRKLFKKYKQSQIARMFNVTDRTISLIKRNITWKHI